MRAKIQYWVHPLHSCRLIKGKLHTLYKDLREHPTKFFSYFRMNVCTFDDLMTIVASAITYQRTKLRICIPAEERMAVTIRVYRHHFLAKWESWLDWQSECLVALRLPFGVVASCFLALQILLQALVANIEMKVILVYTGQMKLVLTEAQAD
ncbi:hypothetical protein PR048_026146 [Dryococelus australis]|uniref:Uncharacterized protein n=1 Tax=Dryococelus australis TaxID=614101 RepID=A0ABQ9GKH8_9NEOP|nr:hypothetical protein PR048_026146 [Dryococelus australis]